MRKDELPVSGCQEDWQQMRVEPGGLRRFCEQCSAHVHDLSAMDERQAQVFLAATVELQPCLAYDVDDDGRILFADRKSDPQPEPQLIPVTRLRPRTTSPTALTLTQMSAAACLSALLNACTAHGDIPQAQVIETTQDTQQAVSPMLVIPAAPPATTQPSAQPEPADAEPCDPPPARPPRTPHPVKGKRVFREKIVGIPLADDSSPL